MNEELERKKTFIIRAAYFAIAAAIYYILFRYVIYMIMPFVIALLVTFLLRVPVDWIDRRTRLPRRGIAAVIVLVAYAIIASLLTVGLIRLFVAVSGWFTRLPALYTTEIVPAVRSVFDWYEDQITLVDPQVQLYLEQFSAQVISKSYDLISSLSRGILSFAQSLVTGIPGALIGVLFCVISTFFMEMDYPQIYHFVMAQFNDKNKSVLRGVKHFMKNTIGKMLFAYVVIMCTTCLELNIGLRLIGVRNASIVALLIAVFDILPALGTGGIVIPWALLELIKGNFTRCLQLLVLYAIITVIRNIIEPKLLGDSTGTNPALLLLCMYLGAQTLGPLGFLILPVTVIIVKNLNDEGLIHIYNSDYRPRPKRKKKEKPAT